MRVTVLGFFVAMLLSGPAAVAGGFTPAGGELSRALSDALAAPSRLVPIAPTRLADTRQTACTCTRLDAHTIRVPVTDAVGNGAVVLAAAVTVTSTNSAGDGFVTAYPAGQARPDTSILNAHLGRDTSNAAIIPVGAGGAIDVYTQTDSDLILDVTAMFIEASSSSAGRFQPVAPTRLLDTRDSLPGALLPGGLLPGSQVTIALPASVDPDASAVALNVTSVGAPFAGFLTGFAAGSPPSPTSFLNPDGSGAAQAAAVILPVSAQGVTIKASPGGHVVVDLVGWFTGPTAPASSVGLFVPVQPSRLLDTRTSPPRVWPGGTRELDRPVDGAAAIATNVTLANPDDRGFVSAYPAGTTPPATSSINAAVRDGVVANFAITSISTRGTAYFSSSGTDLVVDIEGYFTGEPMAANAPVPPNPVPFPRVLLIGDSTLGALNVVPSSQTALRGLQAIVDAEPCRRLVRPSCQSAFTNRVPTTATEAISAAAGPVDMVVIRAGYNDGSVGFEAAVDAVVRAARTRGIRWVIWLTYSDGTGNQINTYNRHNATLRNMAASGSYPELAVAEWRTYASAASGWYASDSVHLMRNGAWATADYITRWVAFIVRRDCPTAWSPGVAVDRPCPSPDQQAAASHSLPDLKHLYGL